MTNDSMEVGRKETAKWEKIEIVIMKSLYVIQLGFMEISLGGKEKCVYNHINSFNTKP